MPPHLQAICCSVTVVIVLIEFSLTVKAATKYSYVGVVRLFHLLRKGNQVLVKS